VRRACNRLSGYLKRVFKDPRETECQNDPTSRDTCDHCLIPARELNDSFGAKTQEQRGAHCRRRGSSGDKDKLKSSQVEDVPITVGKVGRSAGGRKCCKSPKRIPRLRNKTLQTEKNPTMRNLEWTCLQRKRRILHLRLKKLTRSLSFPQGKG